MKRGDVCGIQGQALLLLLLGVVGSLDAWRLILFQTLGDLEHQSDAQEELAQDGPQLRDQVKLHDLTKQRVVSGRVGLELQREHKYFNYITFS